MPDREPSRAEPPTLPHGARAELQVEAFAAARHRIIRADQLDALGVSHGSVTRWRTRGRLRRIHRAVYLYGGGELTDRGRFYAAQQAIGDDAAVGYFAAAALSNFWKGGTSPVDVVVARDVRSRRGVCVHRVAELPPTAITVIDGIRATTPARTVVDLAGVVRLDRVFRRLVHEALVQEKLTIVELWDELDRAPANVPGRARLVKEIADGAKPTRSGSEDDLVEILRRNDFHPFETSAHPPGTPPWVEVDALLLERRLVIEVDGGPWHNTPWRRGLDARKQKIVEGAGYDVLRLDDAELKREVATVDRIWRELRAT
jgi:very-short-patch-repair endonuclease